MSEINDLLATPLGQTGLTLITELVKPAVMELGNILKDQVSMFRLNRQLKMLDNANKKAINKGISIQPVPYKTLGQILEYCSYEDENYLMDKWSSLLLYYADADQNIRTGNFPSILNQLTPQEVQFLDKLYVEKIEPQEFHDDGTIYIFDLGKILVNYKITQLMIDNLERLGLVTYQKAYMQVGTKNTDGPMRTIINPNNESFSITSFGIAFIKACKYGT